MKIFKKAFTLVELIIVIAIITLLTSSSVFYFLDFVEKQKINQKLTLIEDDLKELDKNVKDYEIFDYKLQFNTTNTGYYVTYINNFDTDNQAIEITDITTGTGKIITNPKTGSGIIKIYKEHKLFINKEIDRNNDFEFNFNEVVNYKIIGTQSGKILNEIKLKYFSEENLTPENNDILELIKISETEGGADLGNIVITNIGGKKILKEGSNEYNEIYLFFENNGTEKFIKITK